MSDCGAADAEGGRAENAQVSGALRYIARFSTTEMLDIFEGTQQIQQLIVARRLLGKTSAELNSLVAGDSAVAGSELRVGNARSTGN